jgi:co-chaperonin GroES (HSP10)
MIAQPMANLARENNGLIDIDAYKDCPLPEDYEIIELLADTIQVVYKDLAEDGKSLMRNGIVLPASIVDNRAWRIAEVILAGPSCKQVKKGDIIIFPGDKGLQALQKDGKMSVFLSENRIFGICKPISKEEKKTKKK